MSKPSTILDPFVLSQVFSHCADTYPNEACGFIYATGRVRKCRNAQAEFHAQDPDRYPRDTRQGYAFSLHDAMFLDASLTTDDPVQVVFHSHPDADAYLSDEDVRAALIDGRPLLPVYQLVVAVREAVVTEARLYQFVEGTFLEVERFGAAGTSIATSRTGRAIHSKLKRADDR